MTISLIQAVSQVREIVKAFGRANGDAYDIIEAETIDTGTGWVFFYNSVDFIQTQNPLSALAGNGPIYIDKSGCVQQLSSAIPWQEALGRVLSEDGLAP